MSLVTSLALLASPQALSPVVQVAVNYGPGKSTMVSGFVVGDGRFVLTQANILEGAQEIVVAFTDEAIFDVAVHAGAPEANVALLELPRRVSAELPLMIERPAGAVAAAAMGAPTAFEVEKMEIRLDPGAAAGRRWHVTPAPPPAFRGAPIVSVSGTALGILIEQPDGSIAGVPLAELTRLLAPAAAEERPARRAVVEAVSEADSRAPADDAGPYGAPAGPPATAPLPGPEPLRAAISPSETPASKPGGPAATAGNDPSEESPKPEAEAPARAASATETSRPAASSAAASSTAAAAPAEAPVTTASSGPQENVAPTTAAPGEAGTATAAEPAAASGQSRDGTAAWDARLQADPRNVGLRFEYADALTSVSRYHDAVAVLEQAARDFPSEPVVYWHLAHAYWRQALHNSDGKPRRSMERGAYLRAIWAFEVFLKMAPDDWRARNARLLLERLRAADRGRR